jgi:succinate dehydrogenase hydrophobic anchor subunit
VALVHGGIGLDSVLGSLASGRPARRAITAGVAVVLGLVGLLAVSTIVAFNLS